jgi:D-alanyl-D-alanine dipeptidase
MKRLFLFLSLISSFYAIGCAHEKGLVPVQRVCPQVICDMRYAAEDNFTGQKLCRGPECLLLASTAGKLAKVQNELQARGLSLKVLDAYRTLGAQKKMWAVMPDRRYVEDPAKGPDHCRGAAVDVTLVGPDGKELDMGTRFDEFSKKSRPDFFGIPYQVLSNRVLLKKTMEKHGFLQSRTEWWHFYDKDWEKYPVIGDTKENID